MAPKIIEYSFELPPLEELVKDTEGRPLFTQISHGLQAANQMTLWELYLRSGLPLPKGAILDAGCGDGLFFAIAPAMIFDGVKKREIGRRTVIGVDLDERKVRKARLVANLTTANYAARTRSEQRPEGFSLTYYVQDAQDLAKMDPMQMVIDGKQSRLQKMAMVWSNSMFHWVKEPRDKYAALARFYVMLNKGGVLCMSMSAGGTARDFLEAYNNVMHGLGTYNLAANHSGYRRAVFEPDPIGSRPLDELTNMVEESGFEVLMGVNLKEDVSYKHPLEYANAVRIYGMDAFLNPVSHLARSAQVRVWKSIEYEFMLRAANSGWRVGQPYRYSQFNSYIVAVKKELPEGSSAEEKLLQAIRGEALSAQIAAQPLM
ncbi:class I SAM-dependent methyltransferase [Candidatus Woesearchaeota archaeon]|nr:class I SAM-dependent methyltransferase [Candidatus Woesearchaeota archaeon]